MINNNINTKLFLLFLFMGNNNNNKYLICAAIHLLPLLLNSVDIRQNGSYHFVLLSVSE